MPLFPDAPFPAAPKPRCLVVPLPRYPVVPLAFCLRLLRLPPYPKSSRTWKYTPPCPKTSLFGVPSPEKRPFVPQNRPFWGPKPRKTPLRTPKPAILGSRTWENTPPYHKTCHFGVLSLGKGLSVPQNKPFWDPEPGKTPLRTPKQAILGSRSRIFNAVVGQNRRICPSKDEKQAFRWAKQTFLPIRTQKNDSSLGKTGIFAHPKTKIRPFVGQNGHFCPSEGGQGRIRQQEMASLGWGYVLARRAGYPGRHTGGRIENIFAGDVNDSHICA